MDHATLQWVQADLEKTLAQARQALGEYAEDREASHELQSCADALHSVHGVLEMLEYYGACLLLEEMEAVCRQLMRAGVESTEEACELLLKSVMQLGEYLNYLRAGHEDTPTIFMALLNDLRSVRGEPLLSENALFAPDLAAPVPLRDHGVRVDDAKVREYARRLRAYYQKGMLDWYHAHGKGAGLDLMRAVVAHMEKLGGTAPFTRLWWIAAGVIEALRDSSLASGASVRRLLGQLDQQLKRVATEGARVLREPPPPDLTKNLLYYVACCSCEAERAKTVRRVFHLDDLFVGESAFRRAERILGGPDLETFQIAAGGIKEELGGIKDALDGFVRRSGAAASELAPVADRLRRVADTLGLLNLGRSRKVVSAQVERLRGFVETDSAPSQPELMSIARDLLMIDATLEGIASQGAEREAAAAEVVVSDPGDTELNGIEYLRLVTAVVGEATTELAAVKHLVSEHLREPAGRGFLAEIAHHVGVVEGSLRMLSLGRAADLLHEWGRAATSVLSAAGDRPAPATMDALADALVGLEYYLESVVGLQPNDQAMLELTEGCIQALGKTAREAPPAAPQPVPAAETAEEVDPDIVQVFMDEAREVLQVLAECVQRWSRDPGDRDALVTVRRSFHTLKGSGRLVGAKDIGEYAWAVEELLNRVIEGICPADEPIIAFVAEAYQGLPALIEDFAAGRASRADVPAFAARARALIESHRSAPPEEHAAASDAPPAPAAALRRGAETRAAPAAAGEQDDTQRTFAAEAGQILEFSEAILRHWRDAVYDKRFVKELQRELHTLKGSARMAGLPEFGDLSHAMESVLMLVSQGHLPPSDELLDLIEACHDRLAEMLENVRERREPGVVEDLMTRMDELVCPGVSGSAAPLGVHDESAFASPLGDIGQGGVPAAHGGRDNGRPPALDRGERIQVSSDFLDNLAEFAGELSISHSRFGQQVGSFRYNLEEMDQTIARLRDQLRRLEMETESQRVHGAGTEETDTRSDQFDPLELERFSRVQHLSRSLLESVSDLQSIREMLARIAEESNTILVEQGRVNKDLQRGLMRTRMLPFSDQVQRFRRLVRKTMAELGKRVQLEVEGEDIRLDRGILERITPSIEHILRNAVDHGIEPPAVRRQLGKPELGTITIAVSRSGPEVEIRVSDDGQGLDRKAIYETSVRKALVPSGAKLTDEELVQLILEPGFSTVREVTQISGRGVGLDVVNTDIKQFGGALEVASRPGVGCSFSIRLPFTLAANQALLVEVDNEVFALPMSNVAGVLRVSHQNLKRLEAETAPSFRYAGSRYQFAHLGTVLEFGEPDYDEANQPYPVVLIRAGEHRMAFLVESLVGRNEIVVKSLGPQLSNIRWLSGGTVLGDGRVAMILDVPALVRRAASLQSVAREPAALGGRASARHTAATVLVVDDSITVRQVTRRLLNRNGIDVFTAKDGVEALALLKDRRPDLMLLDIEMPRMDGFELAAQIRKDDKLRDLPIIMITSRTGTKHSDHATDIGVDRYLGKPYHENELLANINSLLGRT